MSKKIKAYLSIFMMSMTVFLSIDTKYSKALGDNILEFVGIRSWSGDNIGLHLTVIYFGVLFFLSLILVKKYAVNQLELKESIIFRYFVVLIIILSLITSMTAKYFKRNSDGLLAVAYENENSEISYSYSGNKLVEFKANFILKNYDNKSKTFYISIDSSWLRKDHIDKINILNSDGTPAIFMLEAGETKIFNLSNEKYTISGGRTFSNGGASGNIEELILSSDNGNIVKLSDDSFIGFIIVK